MNFFHICSLAITFLYLELKIVDVKELVETEVTDMELYCCTCTKNSKRLICNRSNIQYSVCLRLIFMWVWGDIKFRYVWKLIVCVMCCHNLFVFGGYMLLLSCLYSVLWYIATFALNDGTVLYYLSMYECFG